MTVEKHSGNPNALIGEKSPYLLQHAFNPVNWYPWGEAAFAKARAEQKPIFLSIGYSTCHWCHVMERESFESEPIASILNEFFVSIKVDREERPDVDRVYMGALQSMGQNGGWPLSMFLTPDLMPFYGGTYFPPETRYGRYGFPDILRQVHAAWQKDRGNVLKSAEGITKFLRERPAVRSGKEPLTEIVFEDCLAHFTGIYDPVFGGFGHAPKFPRPSVFHFLLMDAHRNSNTESLDMVAHTFTCIKRGGVYDHLGGGFHRYSVDAEWRVPHFEKMLYDQAQLVSACVDLYRQTGNASFADIINKTLEYVILGMTSTEGGFFSAEDADSFDPTTGESAEGAFYVWTAAEIREVLTQHEFAMFCFHYGVEEEGNALADPQQEFIGKNILYQAHEVEETAGRHILGTAELEGVLSRCRNKLFEVRSGRKRPHLDDKVITSWNGLMISAFARSYQALGDQRHLQAAINAARFIRTRLYDEPAGILLRRFRDGEAKGEAHLEDYAFFTQGLLDLYEATGDLKYLKDAIPLSKKQIALFWDEKEGGFYDTSGNDPSILVRTKEYYDGAEPSGNAVAVLNLIKLATITDNADFRSKAEQTLRAFSGILESNPYIMPYMTYAAGAMLRSPMQVVIVGSEDDARTQLLRRVVFTSYAPHRVVLWTQPGEHQQKLALFSPFIEHLHQQGQVPTAYVCENFSCSLPITQAEALRQLLASSATKNA